MYELTENRLDVSRILIKDIEQLFGQPWSKIHSLKFLQSAKSRRPGSRSIAALSPEMPFLFTICPIK